MPIKISGIFHCLFLVLLIGSTGNYALGQATFQRTYGTEADENGIGIIQLENGNSVLLCQVMEDDGEHTDFSILQINSSGAIIFSKRYHIPGNQDPYHIQRTHDGGFLIAGDDVSNNPPHNFIVKLDQAFNIMWSKKVTFHSKLLSHLIKEDPEGNIYYGTDCRITPYADFILMKMDGDGNLLWQHSWGISNNDHIYDIHFSSNGNLYILANKWTSTSEILIICMSPEGEIVWEKSLFQDRQYYPRCIVDLPNEEVLMVVRAEGTGKTALIKMDNTFTPIWYKLVGSGQGDLYLSAGKLFDGKIFLMGTYGGNDDDLALLNMTTDGAINWVKAYGGEETEKTNLLCKSRLSGGSGSVFMIGSTASFGSGMNDIYLVKTDLNGTSGCNEIDISSTEQSLFYNPQYSDISADHVLQVSSLAVVPQALDSIKIVTLCPSELVADFDSDAQIICVNDSVNFTDLSEPNPISWSWYFEGGTPATSINQNPQNILYEDPGSFDVRLIVSDGINFDTLVKEGYIQVLPFTEIDLGDDQFFCDGDTIVLDAGEGYESYLWSNGDTTQIISIDIPGAYWVLVTNEMECPGSDTINITLIPAPDVSLGNDTLICFNEVLTLDAGAGFDTYLWQDGSQGQSLLVTQPGQYWVAVSNICGTAYDTISVSFSEYFDISLGNDTSFCYGHSIVLDAGEGFAAYLWQNGATSQTIIAENDGTYWAEVSDSLGCTATDSINIDVYNDFTITLGDDSLHICQGDYVFLTGPEGYESYLWQDGSDFPSFLADTAGTYWLEVSDESGCAARDTVELIVHVIPANLLGNDTTLCPDSELTIVAPPGYASYTWQDGSQSPTFTTTNSGKFWLSVVDEIGCKGSDTIRVSDFEVPGLGLAQQEWICPGDSLWLSADSGQLSYLWQDGSTQASFLVSRPGLYHVEIETICGFYRDSVEIIFYEGDLDLGRDTVICAGEQITLYPGEGYSNFLWSTGATDSILYIGQAGTYWLKAFDGYCFLTDSIRVDACANLKVPNYFTPNSDTYHDIFRATSDNADGIKSFHMVIFNRWGRIVAELNNFDEYWNGKINGTNAAEGVYFWVCDYSALNKYGNLVKHREQGSVTLLR